MKKLIIALCVGAFALAACSSEEAPAPTKVKAQKSHKRHHGHRKSASAANCK